MGIAQLIGIILLLFVLVASLYVAKRAQQLQEERAVTENRLTTLERRRTLTRETIRELEMLGASSAVLSVLYLSLKEDLRRIKALDSTRSYLSTDMRSVEAALKAAPAEAAGEKESRYELTAFDSEREMNIARNYVQEALSAVNRMHHFRKIRKSQYHGARQNLLSLAVDVGVNSCLKMARQALEEQNRATALSCYRRAEAFLHSSALPSREKRERSALIIREKQEVFEPGQSTPRLEYDSASIAAAAVSTAALATAAEAATPVLQA